MTTSLEDMKSGSSSCCGAPVYTDMGICSDCKEHCDIVEDDDECPACLSKVGHNCIIHDKCTDCRKLVVNCTCKDDALQTLAEEKHANER